MKQITIISGKGGTGKTTITACLAQLANNYVVADCDVDAADLHLLLNPQILTKHDFYSGKGYSINQETCTKCGKCQEICRYEAISNEFIIDPISCDGCGACFHVCPTKAVSETDNLAGEYYISTTKNNRAMVHANLHIAEDNSGKLVAQVRKEAKELATQINAEYILIDGPPGIGCPVNAAIVGINQAIIVTEPTLSGIHDLKRIIEVTKHFNVPAKVIINKSDINAQNCETIQDICVSENTECIAELPYDKIIIEALIEGKTIIETQPNHKISVLLQEIWENIK